MPKNARLCLLIAVAVALLATAAVSASALADDFDPVIFLNQVALNAIRNDKTPPPLASRNLAILHTSIFDAVNAIDQKYFPYYVNMTADSTTSLQAAALSAGFTALSSLFPSQNQYFDSLKIYQFSLIPDGAPKATGISLGQNVANQILTYRATDGWNAVYNYVPGNNPGNWKPTPPAEAPFLLPQWADVTPFAMTSGSQFRMPEPPALSSQAYTDNFNKTKDLGAATGSTRTPDQTQIALFWADGAGTATPPGHWNNIAVTAAQEQNLDLVEDARLFALLNIALADAAISCWDMKREYSFWRPITAIREADTDGNDQTIADPDWTPLVITPPFPSYSSGHSTFSGAAGELLTELFGEDFAFTTDSDGLPGVTRSFLSFWEAAEEAGESRIYGGIHWEFDNYYGLLGGKELAAYVLDNYLQPVPVPASLLLFGSGLLGLLGWRRSKKSL